MTAQSAIQLASLSVDFDQRFQLVDIDWQIEPGQHWLITGTNGSGKSALAAVLAGAGRVVAGSIQGLPPKVALVSYETQAELIEAERRKDDADIMDVISEGTPVAEILQEGCRDAELASLLIEQFGLSGLMDRAYLKLSTGESRKVLLVKALTCKPDLLILDEPFDGLDAATHQMLAQHLRSLVGQTPMVLVLNRFDECPDFITDIAYVHKGHLLYTVRRHDEQAYGELYQLLHLKNSDLDLPGMDSVASLPRLNPAEPLVRLKEVSIRYGEITIFENLSWTIERNQHWQLTGPNGSGKTGLLSLITGDHPQCYVNDIFVFGFQRGHGESIWEIKQYIGYVSTALHREYRVSTSVRNAIISGFYDSIGLYSKCTDRQREIADAWLAVLGMSGRADEPFNKLSYGDQRLLLIARSMVKHPPLLILDEPCLGLDDMNRQRVLALIEKICAGSETSVIYVNHHPEDKVAGIEHYLALGSV
jgi:molybdate transport system ATP-binding protein